MFSRNSYKWGEPLKPQTKSYMTIDHNRQIRLCKQYPNALTGVTKYRKGLHMFEFISPDSYLLYYLFRRNSNLIRYILPCLSKKYRTKNLHAYLTALEFPQKRAIFGFTPDIIHK